MAKKNAPKGGKSVRKIETNSQVRKQKEGETPVEQQVAKAIETAPPQQNPTAPLNDSPMVQKAIAQGKALIAEGKSKADAARAMFESIHGEPKEVIVAAFVAGAALTEKGALTYWYNCKRLRAKEMSASSSLS